MSLKQLMLREIMTAICEKCNDDIRDIKEYLKARYHLPVGYDFSRDMKSFKKIITDKTERFACCDYVEEFIRKFEVKENDNQDME